MTEQDKRQEVKPEPKKCGCGQTKNPDGFCDGSHQNIKSVCPETIADQPLCQEKPAEVIAVFKADTTQFKEDLKELEALLIRISKIKINITFE